MLIKKVMIPEYGAEISKMVPLASNKTRPDALLYWMRRKNMIS